MNRLLPLLFLLASSTLLAESGSYRVEVIVFRNLLVESKLREVPELRSFSQFPDLENSGQAENLPDDLNVVSQKSDEMDNAWRRLRSSQSYQPLVYAAWQQNRVDYYPPVRIHDQQVIDTQLRPPTQIVLADLTAQDPLAAYRSTFYQLDGSLQLRRSRFLHLFVDLELREKQPQYVDDEGFLTGNSLQVEFVNRTENSAAYTVYSLQQNRQISTSEMQYFDTPLFGALVYVTSIPVN